MALIFWIIVGLVLVLTGAIAPVAIFIGWLLVGILAFALVAMLLQRILPWIILIGLIAILVWLIPVLPGLFATMSTPDIVAAAMLALIGGLLVVTKIKDERELQQIRNRKAGDAWPARN
jgi:hypothetical protein